MTKKNFYCFSERIIHVDDATPKENVLDNILNIILTLITSIFYSYDCFLVDDISFILISIIYVKKVIYIDINLPVATIKSVTIIRCQAEFRI